MPYEELIFPKSRKHKRIIFFLTFFLVAIIVIFLTKFLWSNYQMHRAKTAISKLEYVDDPEIFIKTYMPDEKLRFDLKSECNPGQLICYYYHISSPFPPHASLKSKYHTNNSVATSSFAKRNFGSIAVFEDEVWKVFWIGIGGNGEYSIYFGPYRSDFNENNRKVLKTSLVYKTVPEKKENFQNNVNIVGKEIMIRNQIYKGGNYTNQIYSYVKNNVILVRRDERYIQKKVPRIDFRTHILEEKIDVSTLSSGEYRLIIEETLSENGVAFIEYDNAISIE